MPIQKSSFGQFWNTPVTCYTLENPGGVKINILDYGAIIQALEAPGRDGSADIILGFDNLYGYLKGHPFFGAIAGRVANRIPEGRFTIDGTAYQLGVNAPLENHLHGGFRGFDKYIWDAETREDDGGMTVKLTRTSPDGEEGYPGTLATSITYTLTSDNVLMFLVEATTDKPTIVNIVQHSYFNMAGHDSGDVRGQELTIEADAVTPVDGALRPTGEITDVAGTAFDLRTPTLLADAFGRVNDVYDINYVLRGSVVPDDDMAPCARFRDPQSGRTMDIVTNQPGVQFYNGFKVYDQNQVGKGEHRYPACAGICLETQAFPNAVNHDNFPSMVLRPGETYRNRTTFTFSIS